ncbi:hypothetical protein LSTR_LSTR015299 [Laodelphax striatellus]|uniref:Uncharacterized protein n=1 Tax=Laodelphax striatellus TaxID=195883 RepID=A0A482WU30_LAOST|nr:hypothetical protein LSTR_LSTR015299 [Laodelphax striatellus]
MCEQRQDKNKSLTKLSSSSSSSNTVADGNLDSHHVRNHHVRNQLKTKSKLLQNTISKLRNSIVNKHKKLISSRRANERDLQDTFSPIIKPLVELKSSFDNRNNNNNNRKHVRKMLNRSMKKKKKENEVVISSDDNDDDDIS